MKTIEDLDQIINELSEQSQYKDSRGVLVKDKKWKKAQSRVSFLNDMRLYLFLNPTEDGIKNQLNSLRNKKSIIESRFKDYLERQPQNRSFNDSQREYNKIHGVSRINKQITNLNFLLK